MNGAVVDFIRQNITTEDIQGCRVLEVGARDVNGTVRAIIEPYHPCCYIGTDLIPGPGVDLLCSAERLVATFGPESFDVLVSTETIEHIREWRQAITSFKRVVRQGGLIILTTRSRGFCYHAYPHDYWRYEIDDIRRILVDCTVEALVRDWMSPGVMVKARKPVAFAESDLRDMALYSMVHRDRVLKVSPLVEWATQAYFGSRRLLRRHLPEKVRCSIKTLLGEMGD